MRLLFLSYFSLILSNPSISDWWIASRKNDEEEEDNDDEADDWGRQEEKEDEEETTDEEEAEEDIELLFSLKCSSPKISVKEELSILGFKDLEFFHEVEERDSISVGFSGNGFSNMCCRLPQAAIVFVAFFSLLVGTRPTK